MPTMAAATTSGCRRWPRVATAAAMQAAASANVFTIDQVERTGDILDNARTSSAGSAARDLTRNSSPAASGIVVLRFEHGQRLAEEVRERSALAGVEPAEAFALGGGQRQEQAV